jgi:hypothetical protein
VEVDGIAFDPIVYVVAGIIIIVMVFIVGFIQRFTMFRESFRYSCVVLFLFSLLYPVLIYSGGLISIDSIPYFIGYPLQYSLGFAAWFSLSFLFFLGLFELERLKGPWRLAGAYLALWLAIIPIYELTMIQALQLQGLGFQIWPSIGVVMSYLGMWIPAYWNIHYDLLLAVGIIFLLVGLFATIYVYFKNLVYHVDEHKVLYGPIVGVLYAIGFTMLIGGLVITIGWLLYGSTISIVGLVFTSIATSIRASKVRKQKEDTEKEEIETLRKRVEELESKVTEEEAR